MPTYRIVRRTQAQTPIIACVRQSYCLRTTYDTISGPDREIKVIAYDSTMMRAQNTTHASGT